MASQSLFVNTEIKDLPKLVKENFVCIQKKYLNIIVINICFYFVILLLLPALLIFFNVTYVNDFVVPVYVALLCLFVSFLLIYIAGFKYRKYLLRSKDISYTSGLLINSLVTVPFSRIQHIEIERGVFARYFGLASICVYTAGDSNKDLVIKGLLEEEALQIKAFIIASIDE